MTSKTIYFDVFELSGDGQSWLNTVDEDRALLQRQFERLSAGETADAAVAVKFNIDGSNATAEYVQRLIDGLSDFRQCAIINFKGGFVETIRVLRNAHVDYVFDGIGQGLHIQGLSAGVLGVLSSLARLAFKFASSEEEEEFKGYMELLMQNRNRADLEGGVISGVTGTSGHDTHSVDTSALRQERVDALAGDVDEDTLDPRAALRRRIAQYQHDSASFVASVPDRLAACVQFLSSPGGIMRLRATFTELQIYYFKTMIAYLESVAESRRAATQTVRSAKSTGPATAGGAGAARLQDPSIYAGLTHTQQSWLAAAGQYKEWRLQAGTVKAYGTLLDRIQRVQQGADAVELILAARPAPEPPRQGQGQEGQGQQPEQPDPREEAAMLQEYAREITEFSPVAKAFLDELAVHRDRQALVQKRRDAEIQLEAVFRDSSFNCLTREARIRLEEEEHHFYDGIPEPQDESDEMFMKFVRALASFKASIPDSKTLDHVPAGVLNTLLRTLASAATKPSE